jgi:signal-transduction protein with cAMP-binding, CBS, and nucleotidyltransferase domain
MRAAEHYQGRVATVPVYACAREVAETLRARELGCLVVVEGDLPVGMVTDRDLLVRVVAEGRDPEKTRVEEIMSTPLVSVDPRDPLEKVVDAMARDGVRRIAVVRGGRLEGLVSLDDVARRLADELDDLAAGARKSFVSSQRSARTRQLADEVGTALGEIGDRTLRLGGEARDALLQQMEALRERLRRRGD